MRPLPIYLALAVASSGAVAALGYSVRTVDSGQSTAVVDIKDNGRTSGSATDLASLKSRILTEANGVSPTSSRASAASASRIAAEHDEAASRKLVDDFWATWAKPEQDAVALSNFFREDGIFERDSVGLAKPVLAVGRAAIADEFKRCCVAAKGSAWKLVVRETLVRGPFVIVTYDDFPYVPKDPVLAKGVRARHPNMFDGEKPLMNTKMEAFFWVKAGQFAGWSNTIGEIKPLPANARYSNAPP